MQIRSRRVKRKQIPEIFEKKLTYFLVFAATVLTTFTTFAFAGGPLPAGSTAASAPAAKAPGFGSMLFPFAAMFAVVYFLMIRPQQKKMKQQQDMLSQLKHGDEVITSSGILGVVRGITDKVVTLEVADDVKIKVLKSQVSQILNGQLKDVKDAV